MNKEQAIKLLSKDTSADEIHRLKDKGLSPTEVIDIIEEALDMGIEAIETKIEFNKVISSLEKMEDTYRKLYDKRLEEYDKGFADGLEYALMELRGEADE